MPPRYFIGISLPQNLSNKISDVQNKLYDDKLLFKPLVPHITIIHPTALATISPMWLTPKIKLIQQKFIPLEITLGNIETFNNSVLHFKISSIELNGLQDNIVKLLPKDVFNTYYVDKNFAAHITIAQAKTKQTLSPKYIELYKQKLGQLSGTSFIVNNLSKFDHTAPRQYQIKTI
jgi:2'-5' RNA ligase